MQTKAQAANAKFVDENLNKLEEYALEFANTNLPSGYYEDNKPEWQAFLRKWIKVMQYYKWVVKNARPDRLDAESALGCLSVIKEEIEENKPELTSWIELIISPTMTQNQQPTSRVPSEDEVDPQGLANHIYSIASDILESHSLDTDNVNEALGQLPLLKELLDENKDKFSPDEFQKLQEEIESALRVCESFEAYLSSPLAEKASDYRL